MLVFTIKKIYYKYINIINISIIYILKNILSILLNTLKVIRKAIEARLLLSSSSIISTLIINI